MSRLCLLCSDYRSQVLAGLTCTFEFSRIVFPSWFTFCRSLRKIAVPGCTVRCAVSCPLRLCHLQIRPVAWSHDESQRHRLLPILILGWLQMSYSACPREVRYHDTCQLPLHCEQGLSCSITFPMLSFLFRIPTSALLWNPPASHSASESASDAKP